MKVVKFVSSEKINISPKTICIIKRREVIMGKSFCLPIYFLILSLARKKKIKLKLSGPLPTVHAP